jgi:hypothetical protein
VARIDLESKFPGMIPVKSPPAMFRFNGCGIALYGRRDADAETKTYVATWCVSLLFVPCFCLRAYRVSPAQRGWYFIGREPLSTLAKSWNVLLVTAILGALGVVQYDKYVSSPAYKAKSQMTQAHSLAADGHLSDASKIYRTLAIAGADEAGNATTALGALMDNQCKQSSLAESAGVFDSASQVAHRGNGIPVTDVADKGLQLVTAKGDADPRGGIAMLDVVRPLVIDTRTVDERRLSLLRKWAANEPANLDVIIPLASTLEQQDKLDEAKKLLQPFKDKLSDGEGARVLGTILGRQGDYDGAYALLWPYVKPRLDNLHAAEQANEKTMQQLWDREITLLKEDKAPQEFYDKYKAASGDEEKRMVRQYINERLKDDPQYTGAQDAMERETKVVPIALELGMVMLQRAQGQTDSVARKKQLESAEQIFLAIGGVAGQSDEYRLSLGQVYYWLGKQAEGHKLFDDYLNANQRSFPDLLKIATKLRLLGMVPEARTMGEEAYTKASKPEEQYAAASFRALCFKDSDDQIAWLNKADTNDPRIKAELARATGEKAFEDGHDDQAATQFQIAVDAYNSMPRSAMTVNQTALAYYSIFLANGDRQAIDRCNDYFQQALELEPSDPILLYNAGTTLLSGALSDVIGQEIDLRALHEIGDTDLLAYIYNDQASRDALARRVKDHPGVARALTYLDKVMVMSPKDGRAFAIAHSVRRFTQDDAALHALEQRIEAADLDTADQLAATKDFLAGTKDQQQQSTLAASISRAEELSNALRPKGGRTAAVAITRVVERMLTLGTIGGSVDPEKILTLAQEAYRVSPSSSTSAVVMTARLFHASRDLRHSDPAFNEFWGKYGRSAGLTYLMAVAASEPSSFQTKVVQHPDVQEALKILRDWDKQYTGHHATFEWAMLKNTDSAVAEKFADDIRKDPRQEINQSISQLLRPADASEALETYWLKQIQGKPEQGQVAIRKVAEMGIPVPIQH